MFAFFLPLLAKIGIGKNIAIAIAVGIILLIVGGFFWSWQSRGNEIQRLRSEINILNDTIIVERTNTVIANIGTDVAVNRLRETNKIQNTVTGLSEGARNAYPQNDAPLSPVLRDTLIGVGTLSGSVWGKEVANPPRNGSNASGKPSGMPTSPRSSTPPTRNPERRSELPRAPVWGMGELFWKPYSSQVFSGKG